jgi:UDP-N-acetylmuramoyl-tripeptide--D-alanyl-D-alanine ligase
LTVIHGDERQRVYTRLAGEHWTTSVLAAIACGIACGIDLPTCAKVLEKFDPVFARYSVHSQPGGPVYVLDTQKAPMWTIAAGLAFVARARAPRRTIVFGTISDYPGAAGARYRRVAREALEVAERVVFVGPNSGHVGKLKHGDFANRLFLFQSTFQASAFLANETLSEELIYLKASVSDHIERIMLSQTDQVVCWRERCGWTEDQCPVCSNYRTPHAPPFGLAKTMAAVTSSAVIGGSGQTS